MSYDVRLVIDTGGPEPVAVTEYRNPTYNLAPMFAKALGAGLRDLNGKSAAEVIPTLRAGIARMEDDPPSFKKLNPENGWGTYEGALHFMCEFLAECQQHPKATVRI